MPIVATKSFVWAVTSAGSANWRGCHAAGSLPSIRRMRPEVLVRSRSALAGRTVPSGPLTVMRSITSRCVGLALEREDFALVVEKDADDVHRVLVEDPLQDRPRPILGAVRLVHVGPVALLQMVADDHEAVGGLLIDLLGGPAVFLVGRPGDLSAQTQPHHCHNRRHDPRAHVLFSHPSAPVHRSLFGVPRLRGLDWSFPPEGGTPNSSIPAHSPDDSPARSNCAVRCAGPGRPLSSRVSSSLTIRS